MLEWVDGTSEAPYKLNYAHVFERLPGATLWNDGSIIVGAKSPEGAQLAGTAYSAAGLVHG